MNTKSFCHSFLSFQTRDRHGAGGLININSAYCTVYMIDTWLFAALCFIFLSLCAVLRIIPGPTRDDQLIAVNAAITIAAGAALALSISWGNLIVLDASIVLVALCYAGTIAYARSGYGSGGGE